MGVTGEVDEAGPWVQVSRLGDPLFNEVIIPLGLKDFWNSQSPKKTSSSSNMSSTRRSRQRLVEVYPGVFPIWPPIKKLEPTWWPFF